MALHRVKNVKEFERVLVIITLISEDYAILKD